MFLDEKIRGSVTDEIILWFSDEKIRGSVTWHEAKNPFLFFILFFKFLKNFLIWSPESRVQGPVQGLVQGPVQILDYAQLFS